MSSTDDQHRDEEPQGAEASDAAAGQVPPADPTQPLPDGSAAAQSPTSSGAPGWGAPAGPGDPSAPAADQQAPGQPWYDPSYGAPAPPAPGAPGPPAPPNAPYPVPYQPGGPYAATPPGYAPAQSNSSAMVLTIVSGLTVVFCAGLLVIPALVMGIIGLVRQSYDPGGSARVTRYGWWAFAAGVVLTVLAVIIVIVVIVVAAATSESSYGGY